MLLQELERIASENMKVVRAISARKPVYSAEKLEHEYLENVARIDRLRQYRCGCAPRRALDARRTSDFVPAFECHFGWG